MKIPEGKELMLVSMDITVNVSGNLIVSKDKKQRVMNMSLEDKASYINEMFSKDEWKILEMSNVFIE